MENVLILAFLYLVFILITIVLISSQKPIDNYNIKVYILYINYIGGIFMLKSKFKALLIVMFVVLLSLSSFCFADLEEDLVQSGVIDETEATEESIDKIQDQVSNFIPNSSNNNLISGNPSASNNSLITTKEVKKGDAYLSRGWSGCWRSPTRRCLRIPRWSRRWRKCATRST